MQTRTAQLGVAAFWAGIACVLGALAASLAFAFLTTEWSSRWPPSFEIPYFVFAAGFLAAAVGFLPLTAVLWSYLSVARRWRLLERNWYTVCGATVLLALLCFVGAGPAIALVLGSTQLVWLSWMSVIGAYVLAASFVGLLVSRALIPALCPGAPLEPVDALTRLSRSFTPKVVVFGTWITAATAATYFISSEMLLPCADRSLDSCFDAVPSRGFPYPFLQRDFLPLAFFYDLLMLTFLHSPIILWVRAHSRAV